MRGRWKRVAIVLLFVYGVFYVQERIEGGKGVEGVELWSHGAIGPRAVLVHFVFVLDDVKSDMDMNYRLSVRIHSLAPRG